jgi:hypothetical protein
MSLSQVSGIKAFIFSVSVPSLRWVGSMGIFTSLPAADMPVACEALLCRHLTGGPNR